MLERVVAVALCSLGCTAALSGAEAACIDLKETKSFSFEGSLSYRIFAGPPNYEDVRKGDSPEPTYILNLATPICATGDDYVTPDKRLDKIQVYSAESGVTGLILSRDLRRFVGKRVASVRSGLVQSFSRPGGNDQSGRRWSVGTPHPAHQFAREPRPLRRAITSRDAEWIGRTI
jgi:hypothetical protein